MPRLENWSLHFTDDNEFLAPELRQQVLSGNVFDDDRFPNGSGITTGHVVAMDLDNRTAETARTKYVLGKADPHWMEWLRENGFESYGKLKMFT